MEKIAISTFRDNLSVYLKRVQKGQAYTITSRGNEMARLVPIEDKWNRSREILHKLSRTATIGDILSPIDEEWKAMQ